MALIFPLNARKVKWSSSVDQSWTVNEQVTASGKRRALSYQTLPSWSFKIDFPALSGSERDRLFAFYFQCQGSLTPFFYKDAEDYKAEKIRLPKNTDGSYQLVAYMHGQNEPVEYKESRESLQTLKEQIKQMEHKQTVIRRQRDIYAGLLALSLGGVIARR